MKTLITYLKSRIDKLVRPENLIYLIVLLIGVSVAFWKYGLKSTWQTILIFLSALIFAGIISDLAHKLFWKKRNQNIGRQIATYILVIVIILIQIIIKDFFVTKYSISIGISFGVLLIVFSFFSRK